MAHIRVGFSNYVEGIKRSLNAKIQTIVQEEANAACDRVKTRVLELSAGVSVDLQLNYDISKDLEEVNLIVLFPDVKG